MMVTLFSSRGPAADADLRADDAEGSDFDVDVDFRASVDRGVFRDVSCHDRSAPRILAAAGEVPVAGRDGPISMK